MNDKSDESFKSPMARKPKKNHPWKAWNPGALARPAMVPEYNDKKFPKGCTKKHRAQ